MSLSFLLDRLTCKRLPAFAHSLVFPAVSGTLTSLSALICFSTPFRVDIFLTGSALSAQIISLVGARLAEFLLMWLCSLTVHGILGRNRRILSACILTILIVLSYGRLRLTLAPAEADHFLKVAYTTGPYIGTSQEYTDASWGENYESFDRSVFEASGSGARLLVFNEEAFTVTKGQETILLNRARVLSKLYGLDMLLPLEVSGADDEPGENKAVWIDRNGKLLASYEKSRLVPVFESGQYIKGDGRIPCVELRTGKDTLKVSFAICFDSNFPSTLSTMDPETDLLVLPSWDWSAVADLHSRIARSAATEQGVTLLKPTYDGRSIAVDPYGQILHETRTDETGYEKLHTVTLPIRGIRTPGHVISAAAGWFAPAVTLLLAIQIAAAALRKKRIRK